MPSEKRLAMLEQLTQSGQADSFAWYALANEYASFGRIDESVLAFKSLRKLDPDYVPQYLICGTMLVRAGRAGEGREWLESGIIKAREKSDAHAQRELEEALEQVPPPRSIA